MKIVEQNSDRLVIIEEPDFWDWVIQILGGVVVIAILVTLVVMRFLPFVGVLLLSAAWFWFHLQRFSWWEVRFDRTRGTVHTKRRDVFGTSERSHPLKDLRDIHLDLGFGTSAYLNHRVVLVFSSGEEIPLSQHYIHERAQQDLTDEVKTWLELDASS